MSEYWVSQAKFYCKYCNVWIADNKPSRSHHDNGFKHKMAFEKFQKDKRDKTLHGARSERDLKNQLQEIEKAAKEALAQDQQTLQGHFYSSSSAQSARPPPPPRNYDDMVRGQAGEGMELGNGTNQREESSGTYVIRGQTYLEGTMHSDQLRAGVYCELFIEHSEEWVPARVMQRHETAVPHTNLVLKSFSVRYNRLEAFTDQPMATVEDGVKPDRLRLLAYPDGSVMADGPDPAGIIRDEENGEVANDHAGSSADATGHARAKKAAVAGPKSLLDMDPDTGFSAWSTVSVEVVDEKEQARQQRKRLQEDAELQSKEAQAKLRNAELERLAAAATDNVLANVDPYGTGVYKGMFVGDMEQLRETEIPSLSNGATVGFKKRRRPGQEALSETNTTAANPTMSSGSNESGRAINAVAVSSSVTMSTVESKDGADEGHLEQGSLKAPTSTSEPPVRPSAAPMKISMSFKSSGSGGSKPIRQKFNDDDS